MDGSKGGGGVIYSTAHNVLLPLSSNFHPKKKNVCVFVCLGGGGFAVGYRFICIWTASHLSVVVFRPDTGGFRLCGGAIHMHRRIAMPRTWVPPVRLHGALNSQNGASVRLHHLLAFICFNTRKG
ncbi:hypothetical protein Adt_21308 [Abeliophyllum distichum]|uniref:Uncharacterized protein n=1 Tax=Abeliophyllum distichum TaxID=126358 RepID=A0ABD1SZ35_9LAMI